jgi:hypothetical protein
LFGAGVVIHRGQDGEGLFTGEEDGFRMARRHDVEGMEGRSAYFSLSRLFKTALRLRI